MKKRYIGIGIGTLLLLALLVCSCIGSTASTPRPTPAPAPISVVDGGEPPIEEGQTWISPGKVQVGNFYPGARAEWPLTVHNGNDHTTTFEVSYRYPDSVGEGYTKPTSEVQDWVRVADTTPILSRYGTREIMVILEMPEDAVSPGHKWEFWVSVKDTSQGGLVRIELCSRWLVIMR